MIDPQRKASVIRPGEPDVAQFYDGLAQTPSRATWLFKIRLTACQTFPPSSMVELSRLTSNTAEPLSLKTVTSNSTVPLNTSK